MKVEIGKSVAKSMKNFSMSEYFMQNFVIGGSIIGILSVIIKFYSSKFAGFVYGAFPLTFIYLLVIAHHNGTREIFSKNTLYGILPWIIFVFLIWKTSYMKFSHSLLLSLVLFALIVYTQYQFMK